MASSDLRDFHVVRELYENLETRRIFILRRQDGKYCFAEQSFLPPEPEDEVYVGRWMTEMLSGLYLTADDAERDARRQIPWLQNPKTS